MPDSGSAYSFSIFSDLLIKNCTNNLSITQGKEIPQNLRSSSS